MGPSVFLLFSFFSPMGLFLGLRLGSKIFLEPTNVDYQFLFWKAKFWAFFTFLGHSGLFFFGPLGLFWGSRSGSKIFLNLLMQTINSCFGFNMTIWFNMTKQDFKPYRANYEGLNGLGKCFFHFSATKSSYLTIELSNYLTIQLSNYLTI